MTDTGPLVAIAASTAPPVPVDHRDRRRIAEDLSETFLVAAGAGSGKTRHLVERVVTVISTGAARIDELAAITFTEAAAAELRDRIARALEAAALTATGTAAERIAEALAGLERAAITTLHGFARRILAEHPLEAGLPPVFEVLDEVRSVAELGEQWTELLDGLLRDADNVQALQRLVACGGSLSQLRALVRQLADSWDLAPRVDPLPPLSPVDATGIVESLQEALSHTGSCTTAADGLLAHLEGLRPLVARLADAGDDEGEVLRILADHRGSLSSALGKAPNWKDTKPAVVGALRKAESARAELVAGAVGAALGRLGAACGALVTVAAERRRREGRLRFHDLLVFARDLVRDDNAVRRALHGQYRCLFIDEFQDTDPLQAELAVMIAAVPGAPVGGCHWRELETEPGALFFVGDVQQAIYGWRRADIRLVRVVDEHVATAHASLVSNYRSARPIVDWVNAVFDSLVGDGISDLQPGYRRAVSARAVPDGAVPDGAVPDGAVPDATHVVVLGTGSERPARADDARRLEAAEVVATLSGALADRWPVGDEGRSVRPSDITVLVPSRRSLRTLQEALDRAGIAYRLVSSSLVYGAAEVRELLTVLEAIDDPSDAAAVVGAIRTPGLGCGDDDLVAWRMAGGSWDYRTAPPPAVAVDHPVAHGLGILAGYHRDRAWTQVSDLVAQVVEELRLLPAALDTTRWREEWRRLRFVIDQARLFCERAPGDLRQYLAWVDVQRADDARVTEVVLPESDADAVNVMTIHAAKGLEFPVVAVMGMGARLQGVRAPAALFDDGRVELALRADHCTSGYDALRHRTELVRSREALRLLYVAVTRAQDHLVVSCHRPAAATGSVAAQLETALPDRTVVAWEDAAAVLAPPARPDGDPDRAHGARTAAEGRDRHGDGFGTARELDAWVHERARRFAQPPRVVAATGVAKLVAAGSPAAQGPPDDGGVTVDNQDEPALDVRRAWRRGRAGTAVGRAVHAVLQSIDLATGLGVEQVARAQAEAEGVGNRAAEVAALVRAALDSDVVRAAATARHWRELYVGLPLGDHVLEGFVDLVYETPGGLHVVDYKTDQVGSDEKIDALAARYRLQAAAYAVAVAGVTGRAVTGCSLLFLRRGAGVVRPITDLEVAMAEVERALGSVPAP